MKRLMIFYDGFKNGKLNNNIDGLDKNKTTIRKKRGNG